MIGKHPSVEGKEIAQDSRFETVGLAGATGTLTPPPPQSHHPP